MKDVDLSAVKPSRWKETVRRVEVIRTYLRRGDHSAAARAEAAGALGLSDAQFRRLVRSWEIHADPSLVSVRSNPQARRPRKDGLSDRLRATVAAAIDACGTEARTKDVIEEVARACSATGDVPPSEQLVWTALMRARRQNRAPALRAGPATLIGRVWFELPMFRAGDTRLVRPEAIIALEVPSKAIRAWATDIGRERPPVLSGILDELSPSSPIHVSSLEAGALHHEQAEGRIVIDEGAQADLARMLGAGIGTLDIKYRRPRSDARKLLRSEVDAPLSPAEALQAIKYALAAHDREIESHRS